MSDTKQMQTDTKQTHDGARDFDFLYGRWTVKNRRLRERLNGCQEWLEFDATCECAPILGGAGNMDDFRTEFWPGFVGVALRLFDPKARRWSIYWVDNRIVQLDTPVVGTFQGAIGEFFGPDVFEGRPITVRFRWSLEDPDAPRWEQAFSEDDGKTWETNWVNVFTRVP